MSSILNPFSLSPGAWVAGYVAKTVALGIWDQAVNAMVIRSGAAKLPTTGKLKGLAQLETLDYVYLGINSIIEYIFMLGIMSYAFTSTNVGRTTEDLKIVNTIPAIYLIFLFDDFFYTPAHLLMHTKALYKYVHKHHHRQNLPFRGYPDAGNEHPVEQVIGMSCVWGALYLTASITGLHAITILVYFGIYAALAMLNHTRYDVTFSWLGFQYSVRCHEMHHRFPRVILIPLLLSPAPTQSKT
mmetsp:Transcript_22604/g.31606  ORF Transcript_22604/g.31606 Transcript_22604/m.31606 type:complete len:242 (-) Transcript_22604:2-727(-)